MKNHGLLHYFLGLETSHGPRRAILSREKYITDILDCAVISNETTVDTPLLPNVKLWSTDGEPLRDPT